MRRILNPTGPEFEPGGRLEVLAAYGVTASGKEVTVRQRLFNVQMTVGPAGQCWFADAW